MLSLHPAKITKEDGFTYLKARFSGNHEGELWFRANQKYGECFDSSVADAFFLPALLMAMSLGVGLRVESELSELLLFNASQQIQHLLNLQHPPLRKIEIIAEKTTFKSKGASGVGTGLSCGIDSFSAVHTHLLARPPISTRLTHLTQFNHSQHKENGGRWAKDLNRFESAADDLGIPLVAIGTNLSSKVNLPHTLRHTFLNCSAAVALDNLLGKYYYASTFSYSNVGVSETTDISRSDPIMLPLISSESLRFYSTGSDTPRTEKTSRISNIPITTKYLEVCAKHPSSSINCSKCYKCMRTMLTLDILGHLDNYWSVFDIDSFRKRRASYSNLVLKSAEDPYLAEILAMPNAHSVLKKWAIQDRVS